MPATGDVKVGRAVAEEDVKEGHSDEGSDETKEAFKRYGDLVSKFVRDLPMARYDIGT